jgi:hypothetical protein
MFKQSGFRNQPDGSIYWAIVRGNVISLAFTMPALFQMGSLFGINRPFRIRGPITLELSLVFYCRLGVAIARAWELPFRDIMRCLVFPIMGVFSWFFTAHTILTVVSPFLHIAMREIPRFQYILGNIGICLYYVLANTDPFFTYVQGGTWVNATMLYVFAGFFTIHGWPLGRIGTALAFCLLFYGGFWLVSHDILLHVPIPIHDFVRCFQMKVERLGVKSAVAFRDSGQLYQNPLNFIGGVTTLHFFRRFPLPAVCADWVCFVAKRIYVVHVMGMHECLKKQIHPWIRWDELIDTPLICNLNCLKMLLVVALTGMTVDLWRERLFCTAETVATSAWREMRLIVPCWERGGEWERRQGDRIRRIGSYLAL